MSYEEAMVKSVVWDESGEFRVGATSSIDAPAGAESRD